jgi:dihydrolipoamide dehydrogenase
VCLNVGCIPSKALLHAAKVIEDAHAMASQCGIASARRRIDARKLRDWKNSVVARLTGGLDSLAAAQGHRDPRPGSIRLAQELDVDENGAARRVSFATASSPPVPSPCNAAGVPDDPRIIDSTARSSSTCRSGMLVIGGGIIGLEMATVYEALGVKVSVVELTNTLMPGCDRDLVRPLEKRIAKRYERSCSVRR